MCMMFGNPATFLIGIGEYAKHSKDSVRRLVRLFLGLHPPAYFFHQTLTLCPPQLDASLAKITLNRLLDNLTQRFPTMGVIYVEERQKRGGVHYHALLYFFDANALPFAPSKMRGKLRCLIYRVWNGLSLKKLAKRANKMTQPNPDVDYLIKEARASRALGKLGKGDSHWWGLRNRALFDQYSTAPSKAEVSAKMAEVFPRQRKPKPAILPYYGRPELKRECDLIEAA